MIRRPPRSTQSRSSAASDVYKRQALFPDGFEVETDLGEAIAWLKAAAEQGLSLIHISEPTRLGMISYAVFCLKKKKQNKKKTKKYKNFPNNNNKTQLIPTR